MHKYSFSYLKVVIITILAVATDVITKRQAFAYLKDGDDIEIIKDVLVLHYLDGGNDGAAWGLFSGKRILFLVFTAVAMILIGIFIRNVHNLKINLSASQEIMKNSSSTKERKAGNNLLANGKITNNDSMSNIKILSALEYTFAFLMAGAIGNFIDRLLYGYVIDFIYFKLIDFPIFNLADCYVTVSCVVIVLLCIYKVDENEFNKIFTLKVKR